MTTDSTGRMTFLYVRDELHNLAAPYPMEGLEPDFLDLAKALDSIRASNSVHLSDEDALEYARIYTGVIWSVNSEPSESCVEGIRRVIESYAATNAVAHLTQRDQSYQGVPNVVRQMRNVADDVKNNKSLTGAWVADTLRYFADELKTQRDQGGVREGWQWVPVEPTDKMLNIAQQTCLVNGYTSFNTLCAAYQEMLSDAPRPGDEEKGK